MVGTFLRSFLEAVAADRTQIAAGSWRRAYWPASRHRHHRRQVSTACPAEPTPADSTGNIRRKSFAACDHGNNLPVQSSRCAWVAQAASNDRCSSRNSRQRWLRKGCPATPDSQSTPLPGRSGCGVGVSWRPRRSIDRHRLSLDCGGSSVAARSTIAAWAADGPNRDRESSSVDLWSTSPGWIAHRIRQIVAEHGNDSRCLPVLPTPLDRTELNREPRTADATSRARPSPFTKSRNSRPTSAACVADADASAAACARPSPACARRRRAPAPAEGGPPAADASISAAFPDASSAYSGVRG